MKERIYSEIPGTKILQTVIKCIIYILFNNKTIIIQCKNKMYILKKCIREKEIVSRVRKLYQILSFKSANSQVLFSECHHKLVFGRVLLWLSDVEFTYNGTCVVGRSFSIFTLYNFLKNEFK